MVKIPEVYVVGKGTEWLMSSRPDILQIPPAGKEGRRGGMEIHPGDGEERENRLQGASGGGKVRQLPDMDALQRGLQESGERVLPYRGEHEGRLRRMGGEGRWGRRARS